MNRPLILASIAAMMTLLFLSQSLADAAPATQPSDASALSVGIRRSSYGLRAKNADDAWWVARAKAYASEFPGSRPVVIEIVSNYLDDEGSTQMEFARPKSYTGSTDRIEFHRAKLDHERALSLYDAAGVKAIIQFEPGDADMVTCLEIAHAAFSKHPCLIGYGIDAEWYRTKGSEKNEGVPVSDGDAKAWTEKVVSLNKDFDFFIKHFDAKHLPPTYRHEKLWFLDDSQEFGSTKQMMKDFTGWAKACEGTTTGYQYGYVKDKKWWSKLSDPPRELGTMIRTQIPSCKYLFWVDFTAGQVSLGDLPAEK